MPHIYWRDNLMLHDNDNGELTFPFTTPARFDKIVRHRLDTCIRVLLEKNEEYSRNGDRLHNFRSAGRCRGKHPLEALEGMEVKHTISIDDMVRDIVDNDAFPTIDRIEEKFTDAINYLLLKEALIRENPTPGGDI